MSNAACCDPFSEIGDVCGEYYDNNVAGGYNHSMVPPDPSDSNGYHFDLQDYWSDLDSDSTHTQGNCVSKKDNIESSG